MSLFREQFRLSHGIKTESSAGQFTAETDSYLVADAPSVLLKSGGFLDTEDLSSSSSSKSLMVSILRDELVTLETNT